MRPLLLLLAIACTSDKPVATEVVQPDPDVVVLGDDTAPPATPDTVAPEVAETADTAQDSVATGCAACDPAALPFGAGTGTPSDPSRICSVGQLDALRDHPDDHVQLCNDIDLADADFDPIPVRRATFDGGGHTIHNLSLVRPDDNDLSFILDLEGDLAALRFEGATVVAHQNASIAVRTMASGSSVRDLHVAGDVTTRAGFTGGAVVNVVDGALLADVRFDGNVTNGADGGFVGGVVHTLRGLGRRLEARGTLTSRSWKTGCIAQEINQTGVLEGSVCRMTMDVENRSGGLAAMLVGGTIRGSYFEGTLHGTYWVGGLVGESYGGAGTIEQSYAAGLVVSSEVTHGDGGHPTVGRVNAPVTLTDVVWDADVLGVATDPLGGTGLTTAELHDPTHPALATWSGSWSHQPGDYPRLPWE